jgi:hypothetical protein
MTGSVAAALRIGRFRKYIANRIKRFEIGCGIRTRRAPDRRLIHNHHFPDFRIAFNPLAEFLDTAAHPLRRQRFVQHIMNQRRFAGAADAGHHRQCSQWNHQIQIL